MTESKGWGRGPGQGHPCPECGALRAPDNTPMCRCAERASDALREARTAEAAAAEDFDPLRIRPYVELGGPPGAPGEETMPLRPVDAGSTAPLPTPFAPPAGAPDMTDLSLFEQAEAEEAYSASGEPQGRRRRRVAAVAAGGAALAVLAAAGFASGLFSYETPERDSAAPEAVRAAVPDQATGSPSASPSGSGTASPSASAGSSPSPSASTSASSPPSPSASAPSASPSPSGPAAPPPSPSASPSPSPSTDTTASGGLPDNGHLSEGSTTTVLRRGDKGADVAELQARLQQLLLYNSDINGSYNEQVEDAVRDYQRSRGINSDELGVYGPPTRARLEAETRKP